MFKKISFEKKKEEFFEYIKSNEFNKAYLILEKDFDNLFRLFVHFVYLEKIDFSLVAFINYLAINKRIEFTRVLYYKNRGICEFWRTDIVGYQQYYVWNELTLIDYFPQEKYVIEYLQFIFNDGDPYISQYYSSDYFKYLEKKLNIYNNEEIKELFNNIKSRYEKCNEDCNKF